MISVAYDAPAYETNFITWWADAAHRHRYRLAIPEGGQPTDHRGDASRPQRDPEDRQTDQRGDRCQSFLPARLESGRAMVRFFRRAAGRNPARQGHDADGVRRKAGV